MRFADSWPTANNRSKLFLTSQTLLATWILIALAGLPSTALAQVQCDRFYPPLVSIGAETLVQAEGKFPAWPVDVACDRSDVKVAASNAAGKLTIQVAADAAPGVAWVRLWDEVSASKLVPLMVEPIAATAETEPNNKISEATPVELPAVVYGKLAKSGDLDAYRISLQRGQTFVAAVLAHRPLRSPMDAVIQLVDARGNVRVQADDGRGLDPQLVYQADDEEVLYLRIFGFPEVPNSTIGYAGAESFIYTIRMTTDAFVDHVLPLVVSSEDSAAVALPYGWNLPPKPEPLQRGAANDSASVRYLPATLGWQWQRVMPGPAHMIEEVQNGTVAVTPSLPCIFSGHIATRGEIDRVQFPVSAATRYEAVVHSRAHGFPLDSHLRVVNLADGTEVATNDDITRQRYDASVTFTPKAAGEYVLEISDVVDGYGPRHAYSVVIAAATPTAKLSVAEDRYSVGPDAPVEIPISIDRQNGFDQELTIQAQGLPAGVIAEPVISKAKGETSKQVKLRLSAEKPIVSQGHFQIIATVATSDAGSSASTMTATFSLNEILTSTDLWLTVLNTKLP